MRMNCWFWVEGTKRKGESPQKPLRMFVIPWREWKSFKFYARHNWIFVLFYIRLVAEYIYNNCRRLSGKHIERGITLKRLSYSIFKEVSLFYASKPSKFPLRHPFSLPYCFSHDKCIKCYKVIQWCLLVLNWLFSVLYVYSLGLVTWRILLPCI